MGKYIYIAAFFIFYTSYAQQEAQYSQYMYNMNIINPAYVINKPGIVYLGSLYRTQWGGIDGAPETGNIFMNIPLNQKSELSFNYINDQIGEVLKENTFSVDYAHILQLNEKMKLSFGLKAGVSNLAFDFSRTNVSQDPSFQNTTNMVLNIGAGAFLFTEKFYIGLSSPNFLPSDINVNAENLYENKMQLYATAGYIYALNDNIKLKPSIVVKQSLGAPLTFDFSGNALFYDKFEFGISYRYQDAIAFLAAVDIAYNFRIGYAYDYNTSKLNDFNSGTHEIILLYNLDFLKSKKYISPRFY